MLAWHVDLKRAMWRPEYLLEMVARLRDWGYDTLVLEIEDKFRFTKHPRLRHPEAPTHAQWRDLVARCRRLGVEPIPLFQTLGHAESVVGLPEYAHLRERPDVADQYDPTSTEAQAFLRGVIDDMIAVLRPREFLHLGGDETWALGQSEKCRAIVEKEGIGGLYLRHMLPLFEHVRARGLRPMIWADIVLSHPGIMRRVPSDVVMVDWDYRTDAARPTTIYIWGTHPNGRRNPRVAYPEYAPYATPEFRRHLGRFAVDAQTRRDGTFRPFYCTDALRAAGFDVITAPAARCAGDMAGIGFQSLHMPNCFFGTQKGQAGFGALVTSWAVRHNHPEVGLPAAYAGALGARPGVAFDLEAVLGEFCRAFHGVALPEFAAALRRAEARFDLGQAAVLEREARRARDGADVLAEHAARMAEQCGSPEAARARLRELIAGYESARRAFAAMKRRARRRREVFDFWVEGVSFQGLLARTLLASAEGRLPARRAALAARLRRCRAATRRLFARTYPPRGVEQELTVRYGLLAHVLRPAAKAAKPSASSRRRRSDR